MIFQAIIHIGLISYDKTDDIIQHLWLSYNDKKIDITADKQGKHSGIASILGKDVGGNKNPYNHYISKFPNEFIEKRKDKLTKEMFLSASRSNDASIV